MANAIGMVEFNSMSRGIYSADQMVKVSEVEIVTSSPTCPGKYIAIVHGDVAAVETSVKAGEKTVGIVESFSMATMVIMADAILKAADLEPIELRLGNGLGGKALFVFTGDVAAVQSGIDAGNEVAADKSLLVNSEIIPSPSKLLISSLL